MRWRPRSGSVCRRWGDSGIGGACGDGTRSDRATSPAALQFRDQARDRPAVLGGRDGGGAGPGIQLSAPQLVEKRARTYRVDGEAGLHPKPQGVPRALQFGRRAGRRGVRTGLPPTGGRAIAGGGRLSGKTAGLERRRTAVNVAAVAALKAEHRLVDLLAAAGLARSTYCYHQARQQRPDPKAELNTAMHQRRHGGQGRYGRSRTPRGAPQRPSRGQEDGAHADARARVGVPRPAEEACDDPPGDARDAGAEPAEPGLHRHRPTPEMGERCDRVPDRGPAMVPVAGDGSVRSPDRRLYPGAATTSP